MPQNTQEIWFGQPLNGAMRWVRAPRTGLQKTRNRYYESMLMENGRTKSRRSSQSTLKFALDFYGPSNTLGGINIFNKYASGYYGTGYIYFSDPYAQTSNVMPEEWASPGLIERGFRNISTNTPTFAALTGYATYDMTPRVPTWSITDAVGTFTYKATIAIPPTHTLYIGASGTATGTAVVRVRPINPDGSYAATTDLTLLSPTSATRMNTTFAGSSYSAVEVYITRTSTATSTITLASIMGQVSISAPTLTGNHQPGQGHHGLTFADDAVVESYEYLYPPTKGLSTVLEETE